MGAPFTQRRITRPNIHSGSYHVPRSTQDDPHTRNHEHSCLETGPLCEFAAQRRFCAEFYEELDRIEVGMAVFSRFVGLVLVVEGFDGVLAGLRMVLGRFRGSVWLAG